MKNSRIVKIMRTDNGSPTFKKPKEAKSWVDKSISIICPRNVAFGDRRYYTGLGYFNNENDPSLEWENKKLLFSDMLGIVFDATRIHEFNNSINEFYNSLYIDVFASGKELEIGLYDNSKSLGNENRPLALHDYLVYKAVFENNPFKVAKSKEEAESVSLFDYYIHDVTNEEINKLKQLEKASIAIKHYEEVKSKSDIVKTLLSELKLTISKNESTNNITLYGFIGKEATRFEEVYADYTREQDSYRNRLLLKLFINENMITETSSGGYIDTMSKEIIALSKDEILLFFKDPQNAETFAGYKNRYREKTSLI